MEILANKGNVCNDNGDDHTTDNKNNIIDLNIKKTTMVMLLMVLTIVAQNENNDFNKTQLITEINAKE